MRRELEIPFEFARLCFERQNAIAIKVVAVAIVAVEIRTGIARRPVDQIELRIVSASHPGGRGAVLPRVSLPGFRTRLGRLWNRPEPPHFLAGRSFVGRDESAHALVTA